MRRLGPYPPTVAHPKLLPCLGPQQVSRLVYAVLHAALDAESSEGHGILGTAGPQVLVGDLSIPASTWSREEHRLRLVEVVRASNSKAKVARKVS